MFGVRPPAHGRHNLAQPPADDDWMKTRVMTAMPTRLAADKEDYLADGTGDIGRRVGADQHELFVVCDPAEALHQKLEHLKPEFIVLHDVQARTSQSVLRSVAEALRRPVQRLVIRRQGFGTTLATLEFVELPAAPGKPVLRLYGTHGCAADEAQRRQLAEALLGHSRLGVLLVDTHASTDSTEQELRTLGDALCSGSWRNRQLLCVPATPRAASILAQSALVQRMQVNILVTSPAAGAQQAWTLIQDVWAQLRAGRQPALAPTAPAPRPVTPDPPPVTVERARPEPAAEPRRTADSGWADVLRECARVKGLVSCCVFDPSSQRSLAHAGQRPGPASLTTRGSALIECATAAAAGLGLPSGEPEVAITLAKHHLLILRLAGHPGLSLHAVIDASASGLEQARRELSRIVRPGPA